MHTRQTLGQSFKHAGQGVLSVIKEERNMKIHLCCTVLVLVLGWVCQISKIEWLICGLCIGSVLALEVLNSAIEAVVNLACEERHPLAKKAKDAAAGAVLVMAICAFIIGCIIFLPYLFV